MLSTTNCSIFTNLWPKKYTLPKTSTREFNVIIDSLISDNIFEVIAANKGKKKHHQTISNDTKLQLSVSSDDIHFAIKEDNVLSKFFDINIIIPHKFKNY